LVSNNDTQIGINYPPYLTLQPGLTSDFRFHMGDRYGLGLGSDRGAFLDYELAWDRGDDMEGGLTFGGIGRDDWDFDVHQFWRMDRDTTASGEFTLPAGQGIYGSANVTHAFKDYSAILSADHSQTFTGFESSSQNYSFDLGSNPKRIANTPFRLSYGLLSTETSSDDQFLGRREQQGNGVTTHVQSDNIPIDKFSSLNMSWTASKLYGQNEERGIGLLGAVNLSRKFGSHASLLLTYNYTQDNFTDVELGRNMFSAQGIYSTGKVSMDLMGSKSLGIDRLNFFGDLSYHLTSLWRLSYNYTSDRYLATEFLDSNIGLSYRVGWREVGLVWSESTKRFGIQLMGASP